MEYVKHAVCILIFYLSTSILFAQKIDRVDPPNWWINMEHNDLEILVYGQNIGNTSVTVDYPGVEIKSYTALANKNYILINLVIKDNAKAGIINLQFNQNNKTILEHDFPLLARHEGRATLAGFDPSDVIYVITPDRFANGEIQNDQVIGMQEQANRSSLGGRHGGDIKGVVQSLDYIQNMGYTAVWINPLMENNMKEYSYHGYSITDFYKTDARYGTNEQYKQMVEQAKEKGLKIIIDMVANHIGLDHWWMKDLPTPDWINQWDGNYIKTNHKKTVILDPYATAEDKKVFFEGWFAPSMPDINQRNQHVAKYLIQNTIWWIEYAGVSGIRMDTYPYSDMDFMANWSKAVMEEYPNFNIVGEEWFVYHATIAYWQKGKVNPNNYNSNLKTVMDFPLQEAIVKALNGKLTWTSSWSEVYQSIAQDYLYADPTHIMTFADNHDMSRIYTQLNQNLPLWKLAMSLLMTTRGIPSVYYGSEVLLTNPLSDDHGEIRSDFPGGWKSDAVNAFTGSGLNKDQLEAQAFLKKLLQWRKNTPTIHSGKLLHYAPDNNDVYVYFRYTSTQRIMVLLNKNSNPVKLNLDKYKEGIQSASKGTEILTGKTILLDNNLHLPAQTAYIIELQ